MLTVLGDTFKWTQLTFNDKVQQIADAIAPVVNDQANSTPIKKNTNILKSVKKAFKIHGKHHHHNIPPSSKRPKIKQLVRKRSDSLDDAVVTTVVTNRSHADNGIKSFATIIDSGGQKVFLNLYPIFIHNPSLLMVVFKMTDEANCIWKPLPREEYHCPEGVFTNPHQINQCMADLIKHTMANISTYSSTIRPLVLSV